MSVIPEIRTKKGSTPELAAPFLGLVSLQLWLRAYMCVIGAVKGGIEQVSEKFKFISENISNQKKRSADSVTGPD